MNAKVGDLSLPEIDVEEFRKVVRSRRSVRRFTDEPIPDAVLDDCLELATLAPNSSNLQPWEFYVVRTPALRSKLAEACLGQNAATTAPVLIAIVARPDTWRKHAQLAIEDWPKDEKLPSIVEKYYKKNRTHSLQSGAVRASGRGQKDRRAGCGPSSTGSPRTLFSE
ncbi:nitroreductase family protein [Marinobacter sp.]|uniref:nitroreductase family protein n=1 Tax=Marinobacter sp. TaxID=50741 RepID=UPI003A95882F